LEHGKTDEVFKRVNEIIAIKDSIIDNLKNDTIRNLQLNFDHEVEMNAAHERLIRWQRALGIIAFLALCLIGYILWRKHKVRLQRLENELLTKDYIRKMLDLELRATKTETQLAALQSENDENRQEIQRLETEKAEVEEEAKRLLGKETQIIRRGMLLYDQLLKSERVQTWTNSDYEAIAGFFEASHPDAMKEILKKYGRPTTRSMLYLILVDMGKSNDEICRIMSLNGSSLRSLKHRLRKNMEDSQ
jgi:cell division protein FtsB